VHPPIAVAAWQGAHQTLSLGHVSPRRRPFLTARWTDLVVANFEVDPATLRDRVPQGTTLDRFAGRTYVSLVAFLFEDTRLLGALPAPPSPTFEEINLRFYVKREEREGARRAVCFVKEVVPSRLVAWTARVVYDEPYERRPTHRACKLNDPSNPTLGGTFEYGWTSPLGEHRVSATTRGALRALVPGSLEEFILEHYWGYTQRRDDTTSEYEVRHPPWRYWDVGSFEMDPRIGAFYGSPFVDRLREPSSVFVAEGSDIAVYPGRTLDPAGRLVAEGLTGGEGGT
jgi:uncharacterized protein YqjF (DUF2071 family)